MKKLMTVIAAVATAFGLYAADTLNNSVNFSEFTTDQNPWTLTDKDGNTDELWTWSDTAPALNEAKIESGKLVLKTGSKVLSRNFAETTPLDIPTVGLFADMKINLNGEALDEVPDVTGAKIALFALDGTDIAGLPDGTNLYVYAAYGATDAALFKVALQDAATFIASGKRLQVKAFNGAVGSRPAFLIAARDVIATSKISPLDILKTDAVYTSDDDGKTWTPEDLSGAAGDYLGGLTVKTEYSKWIDPNQRSLFVSMGVAAASSLTSVDFKGNAALTSIALANDDENKEWPDNGFTMAIAAGSLEFEVVSGAKKDGNTLFATAEGGKVVINNIAKAKAYVEVKVGDTKIDESATSGQYEFDWVTGATLSVRDWDAAATVNGVPKESLFGDDGAIATVIKDGGMLKLVQDVAASSAKDKIEFSGEKEIFLDLAGKTLTAFAGASLSNTGKLTIMDSQTGGTFVGDVENVNTLVVSNGVFNGGLLNTWDETEGVTTIYGGTFEGAVENDPDGADGDVTITAFGGKFVKGDDQEPPFNTQAIIEGYAADGYIVDGETAPLYWTVVEEPDYVAQIIRDDGATTNKYTSLQAALDDAAANEVIEVIADINDVDITVSKKVTINGGSFTLTGKAQTYAVKIVDGGDLTVAGGTYLTEAETTQSLFLVGNDASVEGGTDASGSLTISAGTFGGANVGNLVKVSKGSANFSGGIFNVSKSRGIKADGPNATVYVDGAQINADGMVAFAADQGGQITIDGGSITGTIQLEGNSDASTITIKDGTIDGEILRKSGTAKGTITIPGDSQATFDRDQTAFCATGYKTKLNGEIPARYAVVAIQYWTVTITPVDNCTIAVTNGETEVTSGAQFDQDDTTVLKVTRTPAEGYELDGCAANEEITLTGNITITAAVKKAEDPYPPFIPDDPEVKTKYDSWKLIPCPDGDTQLTEEADLQDAFLLNCAPGETALETAKAAFTITSITQDDSGNWIVKVTDEKGQNQEYGNGYVNIISVKAKKFPTAGDAADFFQATLTFKPVLKQ